MASEGEFGQSRGIGRYQATWWAITQIIDHILNHPRQPRPHILDTLQALAAHLPVHQPYILRQVLDGPSRLAIRPHAAAGLTFQSM